HTLQDIQGIEYIAERIALCLQSADLYHDLLQARAQAEQADHLKTRLLANVSHEFRTPLNSILQQTQSILHSISSDGDAPLPQVQRTLQQVVHQTQHLARLVNDLLDLSRAETDELTIMPEVIATRSFLIDFFEDIAEQQPAPGAPSWKLQLPERLPTIEADPVRLRQIFLNLLDNARKFTASGQIVLGADVVLPFLHIWVEDTGSGIPSEQQERIFEPFVTGDQSKRRPEGVGLGLAITRRLVALHRGKLTLDSQPGIGSTFHIYLPLPQLDGQTVQRPAAASAPLLYYLSTHDHPSAAIAELCRRQQLQMRRLDLADDLDRLWAEAHPQIIAWDVSTAEPEDWLLLQRLRAHPHFSQVPFLLYTSDEASTALGMTNVLTKPIERQTLITMLEAMMPPDMPGTILIVDDDPQTCELYQRLATHTFPGRALHAVTDGATALQWLEHEVPCLVILDLVMPDVDGFMVLEHLRSAVHTRNVPVLVLSGHVLSAEEVQRLNYARVIFQNKDMLTPDELTTLFQHTLAGPPLPAQTSFLIKQFLVYLQHHYAQDLSLHQIASEIGVSARHLNRIVHQELGLSPKEYMNRYRIQQAIKLLRTTSTNISTVAALVGFDDPNYFSRVFRQHTGYAPGTYRARAL
ncbi:MAG TPA: ATP-binding protein, partial [Ktedonobacteraceae bacterium]|nr:ATP-binding protein [Ktedonobacteraceae bacterium]